MSDSTTRQQDALIELGVDVDEATVRFAGKYELYRKSLKKFVAGFVESEMTSIEEAQEMDIEEFRRYLHSMKGVTGNLSITKAYQLFAETEQSAKTGIVDYDKYAQLLDYWPATAKSIFELLTQDEDEQAAMVNLPRGEEAECRQLLAELRGKLLLGKALECERIIKSLSEKEWDNIDKALLKRICQTVDNYEFDMAVEMIDGT
ncbi:MAG: hypothetical protein LBC96_08775 [Lachnospiraceae bacterium]|jgi:HPt (histidine-containing phosphotransfer) domain-containing protein|nr:hypothetical protein [Lachnospiraceae bacterium]